MEDLPPGDPTGRPRVRSIGLRVSIVVIGIAVLAAGIMVATTPSKVDDTVSEPVEAGGLTLDDIDVTAPSSARDDGVLRATVHLDGAEFPTANDPDDDFVLFQLAGGRFDTSDHTDDLAAERVLDLSDDFNIEFDPGVVEGQQEAGDAPPEALPKDGRYTLSLDGHIEYTGIPSGTWELRAYVVDRHGDWDGTVVTRTVDVE